MRLFEMQCTTMEFDRIFDDMNNMRMSFHLFPKSLYCFSLFMRICLQVLRNSIFQQVKNIGATLWSSILNKLDCNLSILLDSNFMIQRFFIR